MDNKQPRRDVTIESATITKEIFLKGTYTERLGKTGSQSHAFGSDVKVHDDLRVSFAKLKPHMIALADLHDANGPLHLDRVTILGFKVSGEGTAEGIVISGTRELPNLKILAINTPWQAWDDQVTPYAEASELSLLIEECKAEVYSYIFEDKHAADLQGDLFATPKNEHEI